MSSANGLATLRSLRVISALSGDLVAEVSITEKSNVAGLQKEIRVRAGISQMEDVHLFNESQEVMGAQDTLEEQEIVLMLQTPKTLLITYTQSSVQLWDSKSGRLLATFSHGKHILLTSVDCSEDGHLVATTAEDKTTKIWNVKNTVCQTSIRHYFEVQKLRLSPNSLLLVALPLLMHSCIHIWDVVSGNLIKVLTEINKQMLSAAFSPDSTTLAFGDADGQMCIWRIHDNLLESDPSFTHTDAVTSTTFAPNGDYVLARCALNSSATVWETKTRRHKLSLQNLKEAIFSPDSKKILTYTDFTGTVWNLLTGRCEAKLSGKEAIAAALFSCNSSEAWTCSKLGSINLWNFKKQTYTTIVQLETPRLIDLEWPLQACFLARGNYLLTTSRGRNFKLWKVHQEERKIEFQKKLRYKSEIYPLACV